MSSCLQGTVSIKGRVYVNLLSDVSVIFTIDGLNRSSLQKMHGDFVSTKETICICISLSHVREVPFRRDSAAGNIDL